MLHPTTAAPPKAQTDMQMKLRNTFGKEDETVITLPLKLHFSYLETSLSGLGTRDNAIVQSKSF
ncbi:MAG: hypothetical protein NVV72_15880 [Asticcacaulis sp.]|nr:hypothetical protein [Asticcacaulis sp.]